MNALLGNPSLGMMTCPPVDTAGLRNPSICGWSKRGLFNENSFYYSLAVFFKTDRVSIPVVRLQRTRGQSPVFVWKWGILKSHGLSSSLPFNDYFLDDWHNPNGTSNHRRSPQPGPLVSQWSWAKTQRQMASASIHCCVSIPWIPYQSMCIYMYMYMYMYMNIQYTIYNIQYTIYNIHIT